VAGFLFDYWRQIAGHSGLASVICGQLSAVKGQASSI
jgi:hypothetical protein